MTKEIKLEWIKVGHKSDLQEGRVKTVTAGVRSIALVHFDGQFTAMNNHCPHQGGPLGEGSIEKGEGGKCWIRCPWHGWDFDPLTGKPPGGHQDSGQEMFPVDVRDDGGIYIGVEPEPEHDPTISDIMVETMVNWGVTHVFGMVGHSNLGLADALRKAQVAGKLEFIGVRHEGAAAFAASGYAKLTGKPAACFAIAGPGSTNLLTGLWDAKMDRAPILALNGQVDTQVLGPGAFQEINLIAAFDAVSDFAQIVLPTSKPAELMNLALKNAIVKRGVSQLVFPDEVQSLKAKENQLVSSPDGRLSDTKISPPPEEIAKAIIKLCRAERPMIIVGYGARQDMAQIVAFAEKMGCPVAMTFKAKGQLHDDHPNCAGVLGRSGTPIASWFMNECDLLIVLGASFSNHTGIEKSKQIIQVDSDRMTLGKTHPVDLAIWGDIDSTMTLINTGLPKSVSQESQVPEIKARRDIWINEKTRRANDDNGKGINSAFVFKTLSELVPSKTAIAVDVGNNTYSFGRYFETKPNQRIMMSGYLGSIGFSFPAAIGAWSATQVDPNFKDWSVVSISGDGGFGQYLADFTTAVKYGINITHILLNNSELGKISKEQISGEWNVWQTTLHNPSFAAYAKICGGKGWKVTKPEQLEEAVRAALKYEGPSIVEIITDATLI